MRNATYELAMPTSPTTLSTARATANGYISLKRTPPVLLHLNETFGP